MNEEKELFQAKEARQRGRSVAPSVFVAIVCLVAALSILLTYTFTAAVMRKDYTDRMAKQQSVIDKLRQNGGETLSELELSKLDLLAALFEQYAYYAGDVDNEALMDAVLKAYAEATGDDYAEYYTEAEYAEILAQNAGDYVGIGVSVIQTTVKINSVDYPVYQVIAVYDNAPAAGSDVKVGDLIWSVETDEGTRTVADLGYTKFLNAFKGAIGTTVEFTFFRPDGDGYETKSLAIRRDTFEASSVRAKKAENDPTVGIIQITNFDMTTPVQLKSAVNAFLADGVEHFIFDVRNNPGGDLQSIKAVMTYFLQENDLILSAIDRDGGVARSYRATAQSFAGDYASCSVAKNEIGMYADLDMVVICNENTASAAEVFTATMRDYGLATIVGETTFGKGIMQTFISLSAVNPQYSGYLKMTNYAYVTKCGVTYHGIGIAPDVAASLSEEAMQYNFYVLPQSLDGQLQAAIAQFE